MTEKKHPISLVDFVILTWFYLFQTVYERIAAILNWDFWRKPSTPAIEPDPSFNVEKRHFIQLYKTEPTGTGEKPTCYMNVIEFDSPVQEKEIRNRKRSYDFQRVQNVQKHYRTRSENDLQRFYCSNLRY